MIIYSKKKCFLLKSILHQNLTKLEALLYKLIRKKNKNPNKFKTDILSWRNILIEFSFIKLFKGKNLIIWLNFILTNHS
jgi:hypothetical protein